MSPNVPCRHLVLLMNLKSTCWAAVSESKCEVESFMAQFLLENVSFSVVSGAVK